MSDQNNKNFYKACCAVSRENMLTTTIPHAVSQNSHLTHNEDLVSIKGGPFVTGTTMEDADLIVDDGEAIRQEIDIADFYLDQYPVTNAKFQQFVQETNYVTDAEKFGWSFVFHLFVPKNMEADIRGVAEGTPWWIAVNGADWRHPEGRSSTLEDRYDHPVVHVSWNDAQAYAMWANKRLPTEAEWEYAAAGGVIHQKFPWGNKLLPNGIHQANIWQGQFPTLNSYEDGYIGIAPVHSFSPNAFGLYNMVGNVWEWSADTFTTRLPNYEVNPTLKLIKGGSYLCHASYCNRYRIAARTYNSADSSTGHMSFRCAADSPSP